MSTKIHFLAALAGVLFSASAWAQYPEMELVFEPGIAESDDTIKVSVINSACYSVADVNSFPSLNRFTITFRFDLVPEGYYRCLDENPDAPDFETTIGPLAPGEYVVGVRIFVGGFVFEDSDSEHFSVVETPPAIELTEGGITGLYHRPDSPHQYFYVLENDYNTLLVWNTFDANGDQMWVYGVGDLLNGGQSVVAETYINRSIGFVPSGEPDIEAEPWGTIRVDLSSCTEGVVTYVSELPGFDSGQFPIKRLAYSKQIGCDDSE